LTKNWDTLRIAQCLELSLAETPKNEDLLIAACHFWSNGVNAFLFPNSAHPKPTWCTASTAAVPPTRQRGAAPMRAGGNDRRFLFFAFNFDSFLVLTITSLSG
jgi:hypothetical protein